MSYEIGMRLESKINARIEFNPQARKPQLMSQRGGSNEKARYFCAYLARLFHERHKNAAESVAVGR
jgi:hypothetical protein